MQLKQYNGYPDKRFTWMMSETIEFPASAGSSVIFYVPIPQYREAVHTPATGKKIENHTWF